MSLASNAVVKWVQRVCIGQKPTVKILEGGVILPELSVSFGSRSCERTFFGRVSWRFEGEHAHEFVPTIPGGPMGVGTVCFNRPVWTKYAKDWITKNHYQLGGMEVGFAVSVDGHYSGPQLGKRIVALGCSFELDGKPATLVLERKDPGPWRDLQPEHTGKCCWEPTDEFLFSYPIL